MIPPRYSPARRNDVVGDRGAEVDDDAGRRRPVVGGDGVDEPVGADLARVVDPDRHPGPDRGPDDEHLVRRGSGAPSRVHCSDELRHGRGDDRGARCRAKPQPAQRQQVAPAPRRARRAVDSRTVANRQCSDDLSRLAEHAEVGLGVTDVDDQQHAVGLPCHRRDYMAAAVRRAGRPDRRPSAASASASALARRAASVPGRARAAAPARTAAARTSACGQRQPLGLVLAGRRAAARRRRSRAGRGGCRRAAAELALDRLARVEQLRRARARSRSRRQALRKSRWSSTQPDRLGLVDRGGAHAPRRRGPAARRRRPPGARAGRRCWSRARGSRARGVTGLAPDLDRHLGHGERERRLGLGRLDPDGVHARTARAAGRRSPRSSRSSVL